MALSRKHRIAKGSDFEGVFKKGRAVKGSFLFIKTAINQKGFPRFAFVASKKMAARAVDRNRLRRILTEVAADFIRKNPAKSCDAIVVINKNQNEETLRLELIKLLSNI